MNEFVLETERLFLRKMEQSDFDALCGILQDAEVMYAYEHAFSEKEVQEWLDRQLGRYRQYHFGLWAVVLKETGKLIGQCGITMQECNDQLLPEVGYLFRKDCWHQGYATEAAIACRDYAFDVLGFEEVYSIIRENNLPSQKVAQRNGMTKKDTVIKYYYHMEMPHIVFSVKRSERH